MKIKKYQVDAFAEKPFEGNPAVVCPLEEFLSDDIMQHIAMEHNLSETAFIVDRGGEYDIRWFTPKAEVELCGHATLASAFVIFTEFGFASAKLNFNTRFRGPVSVERKGDLYELDFPTGILEKAELDIDELENIIRMNIRSVYHADEDLLIELETESAVQECIPNLRLMIAYENRGFIVTAPSKNYDFVSRFFAPRVGVDEDPVTGSAHTRLIPFWYERLGKEKMLAKQISSRGGVIHCEFRGDRVGIGGHAVLYSKGEIVL